MNLTEAELERFHEDGVLVLPGLFSADEVAVLRAQLPALFTAETEANIREKAGGEVRTAMGLHLRNPVFAKLVRHPRLVGPALQILGEDCYIQQVKVNAKTAFTGDVWQWHHDFGTHHNEDGSPEPRALNLHVFLDDVTEFNGPLVFIRGSHKEGPAATALDTETTSYPLWCVDTQTVRRMVADGGLLSAKGPAGTGLVFGDAMVHGSSSNISPFERRIFSLILNPVSNALTRHRRPDYKHHRDLSPVAPLADDCLVADSAA